MYLKNVLKYRFFISQTNFNYIFNVIFLANLHIPANLKEILNTFYIISKKKRYIAREQVLIIYH